jgi:hypothetical protein
MLGLVGVVDSFARFPVDDKLEVTVFKVKTGGVGNWIGSGS